MASLNLGLPKETASPTQSTRALVSDAQLSLFQHQNAIHLRGDGMIMSYNDETGLQFLVELQHKLQHVAAVARIEITCRFIR